MKGSRLPNTLLGLSLLSLVLGAGNLIIGQQRSEYYQGLQIEALAMMEDGDTSGSLLDPVGGSRPPSHSPDLKVSEEGLELELERTRLLAISVMETEGSPVNSGAEGGGRTLEYIEARYNFYRFCVLGGKCFVAASGAFLFLWLLVVARGDDNFDSENGVEE